MGRFLVRGIAVFVLLIVSSVVDAQTQTFIYTVSPLTSGAMGFTTHFDAGLGEGSMGFSDAAGVDGRLGADWRSGSRWMVRSGVGFGKANSTFDVFSGQLEGFVALKQGSGKGWAASVGGGARWERDGGTVGLFKVLGGWQAPSWRLEGNVTFEKAAAPQRDPVDIIVSMGWSHRVTQALSLGVEAVGQDLEGFWESAEAEGGARMLVGPSLHVQLQQWEAGVAGGYNFRPTVSGRTGAVDRPLGSGRWVIQGSVGRSF